MLSNKNNGDYFNLYQSGWWFLYRRVCSDETHSKYLFRRRFGRKINLDSPNSFNEKIQWIKLYDRNTLYLTLCNKLDVRDYVKNAAGLKYLTKLHYTFENSSQIDYELLSKQFVLKATHGSGMNIICFDKTQLNLFDCNKSLKKWLKTDYYKQGREWGYRNSKRCIICEELLIDENGNIPDDYKFFCFNGVPKYIQVDVGRFTDHKRLFYNIEWNKEPFGLEYPLYNGDIERPMYFNEMQEVCIALSKDIPFCRVDLYALPEVKFGEITLYPGNGQELFYPEKYDNILGGQINLPKKQVLTY